MAIADVRAEPGPAPDPEVEVDVEVEVEEAQAAPKPTEASDRDRNGECCQCTCAWEGKRARDRDCEREFGGAFECEFEIASQMATTPSASSKNSPISLVHDRSRETNRLSSGRP